MSSSSNAQHGSSNQQSDHATKRKEAVERILALPEDHYFEILDLPVTKESPKNADVTHAYRKISLLVHPDKISDDSLKPRFTDAFRRLQTACEKLGGDIKEGAAFHPSAYKATAEDATDASDLPRPQEDSPPPPDEFHKKIYEEATPIIRSLFRFPANQPYIKLIKTLNAKIVQHNKDMKKPEAEQNDNTINLNNLLPHYEEVAKLLNNPATPTSRSELEQINHLLTMINDSLGYPSTWIAEVPLEWPQNTENSSKPGKGKSAADQAGGQGAAAGKGKSAADQAGGQGAAAGEGKSAADQAEGQGAAAASFDPYPTFTGVRTRDNEPILGYRKVGRDGRQYLVQTDGPENPAFEFRSQAGDDGVGRRVGRAYEASDGAVLLGEVDKKFTKEDAHRYVGIKGVAYKAIQVASDDCRERYPVTSAWAVFQNPKEQHWVYRTTLRRVAGKRDADLDIHDWSKNHGLVPSDQAPPRNYLIKNDAYASVFPRRARAGIGAVDEVRALPEIKTLTDDQKELHTRLDKLEKDFKDEQKKSEDRLEAMDKKMEAMDKKMDRQFAEVMAAIAKLSSGPSQSQGTQTV